jgi:hypothetical protein
VTDLYDPAIRLSTITGVLGDALTEMHKRGEKIDDRVMRLYLDLVVDKLKTAALCIKRTKPVAGFAHD